MVDDGLVMFDQLAPGLGIQYSRMQLRNLVQQGSFPPPLQLSGARIAWRLGDLKKWLHDRPLMAVSGDQPGGAANA
jgi:predicted DNA-binding transcriptional regulator AlpA